MGASAASITQFSACKVPDVSSSRASSVCGAQAETPGKHSTSLLGQEGEELDGSSSCESVMESFIR